MQTITFDTKITNTNSVNLILLPESESKKLPSRGIVMVKGNINKHDFQTVLEPDGRGSHWFFISKDSLKSIKAKVGDTVSVSLEASKDWIESEIPSDLKKALNDNPTAKKTWEDITPMARWDWIRWIRSTNNPETRKIRIEKTFSKFVSGKRSPCCFNRSMCTVPDVSQKGLLIIQD